MLRQWMTLCAIALMAWCGPAEARKVALVIGNAAYRNTEVLANPINDSRLIARAARSAGFEVTEVANVSIANFRTVLRTFREAADGADVALIYYAGHGMEGQGSNWLLPVDAKLVTEFDLPYEAINLDRLLEAETGARVRIVVLDACRNNPFGKSWKRGVRAVSSGLAGLEVDDVMVLYAAAPGQVATDGRGGNSPFAESLARRLPEPGLAVQLLGGVVRDDVMAATGNKQRPYVSASITGTPVYLVDLPKPASVAAPVADRSRAEALMWQGASSSDSLSGYQSYLQEFPQGIFAKMARDRIAALRGGAGNAQRANPALAAVTVPPPVAPVARTPVQPNPQPASRPPAAPPPAQIAATRVSPPPLSGQTALPQLPGTPAFPRNAYPDCLRSDESAATSAAKAEMVNRCTVQLDQYYSGPLANYRKAMIDHQTEIARIYDQRVANAPNYSQDRKESFYQAMMQEHTASGPEGAHFAEYRAAEARYKQDRVALQDKYARYAKADPAPTPAPAATTPSTRRRPGSSLGF